MKKADGGEDDGDEDRATVLVEHVAKQLESTTMNKASVSQDMSTMDQVISGSVGVNVWRSVADSI
jgi:uncharacterized protein YdaT